MAMVETSMPVAVRVRGVTKRFRRILALRDCSFELPTGRITALTGASGAGKSTLMKIMIGFLKPDTGDVAVKGRMGFVAQDKPLYPHFTAMDVLKFGARLNMAWNQSKALEWLDNFDIPLTTHCRALSEEQRTLISLALTIGSSSDLVLIDEPFIALDSYTRQRVSSKLVQEVLATGMTLVLSSRVAAEVCDIADYLLLLDKGRVMAVGSVNETIATNQLSTIELSEDEYPFRRGAVIESYLLSTVVNANEGKKA
jgi:ABC-2 type transport system ATP-binding protein